MFMYVHKHILSIYLYKHTHTHAYVYMYSMCLHNLFALIYFLAFGHGNGLYQQRPKGNHHHFVQKGREVISLIIRWVGVCLDLCRVIRINRSLERKVTFHLWILTVSAVLSLPAWVADLLPTFSTSEVAKGIIPRATKDRTAFSVVMLIAYKSVWVLEVSATTGMQVTGPYFPNSQMSLCSQAANETFWILWRGKG